MTTKKETKKDLTALLAEEADAIDANRDAAIAEATSVSRGHGRSKTLQIRLNPEEFEELEREAAGRGLPTSTVAREAILRLIRRRRDQRRPGAWSRTSLGTSTASKASPHCEGTAAHYDVDRTLPWWSR